MKVSRVRGFPKLEVLLRGGPKNEDYSRILGLYRGLPIQRN